MQTALTFLNRLRKNNRREWFDAHKNGYLTAKEEFTLLIEKVLKKVRRFDRQIGTDIDAADCIFRIYRDIRFSKDKTPYKKHLAADINPGGRKSAIAGYYIHAEPGNSFVAGGVWMPDGPTLQAIRQEIDYNPEPLLKIFRSSAFRKYFNGLDNDDKMVTAPKGYRRDHPQIDLLKNRHFIASSMVPDKEMFSHQAVERITERMKALVPLLTYLRQAQGLEASK